MPTVTVTAIQAFEYEGHAYRRGDVFVVSPVMAAVLRYQHKIVLGGTLPPPTVPATPPRRRRSYRRRDMLAESSPPEDPV